MTHAIVAPFHLPGGAILKNRIAKSAMSERLAASDGVPNAGHLRLYQRWSEGGAGLLVTGNVMVDRRALGESGNVVIEDESRMTELVAWARASTIGGNHAFVQLNHPGRQSPRMLSKRPVAPSPVPLQGTYGLFAPPRALDEREIEDIVDRFARSAAIIKAAGFTGVQVHGAHGYLVSQFLSPRTNLRDDRWGGSVDNRRRFLIEIVRRIRSAVGRSFPVSVKLNSADFQRGGFDETESMAVVEALEAEGIDLLEISGGTYESAAMFVEVKASTRAREAFFLEYAEKVRARSRLPLMVTGGFRSRAVMNSAIDGGAVDVVGLARPMVLEPDLPAKLLGDQSDSARPVNVSIGVKRLDPLLQGAFYQAQIRRVASGLDPRMNISRFAAVVAYLTGRGPVREKAVALPHGGPTSASISA
jgi:2,4-dienoyl-CoA reductase-like NADH-dependent reductase (Old Yellow Enzyme family)